MDTTHDVRPAVADRHDVEDAHPSGRGGPDGLQRERVADVAARHDLGGGVLRRELPPSVVGCAEHGREAGWRVETWQAEPVDAAVVRDEGRGMQVPDEGVALQRHGLRHGVHEERT